MIGEKIIESIRSKVPGKQTVSSGWDGMDYLVRVEDFDRYSLVLSEVGLINTKRESNTDFEAFKRQAHDLEDRLAYFPERLRLLELDHKEWIALYRSDPPKRDNGVIEYYEILYSGGKKINFFRIVNTKGEKEVVSMVHPDHLLVRLIDDFAEAVCD
ncbi:MAG: hypothetical protein IEMM0008_1274 [bacterium]|nr:MAG: hypothetical protein IEMM0008_1274 [bacterium]